MTGIGCGAVIFDLDGVIVDSAALHRDSWRLLMRELGGDLEESAFWQTFGLRNDAILRRLVGPEVTPEDVRRLGDRKEEIFRTLARGRLRPLPGAEACVRGVRAAGCRAAVASSAPRANIVMMLDELALADQFQAVVSGDDVALGKPNPEIFLRAASALGVPPSRCVVVEDAEAGIEAAKRAGMVAVAVARGAQVPPGLGAADLVVASLLEVSPDQLCRLVCDRG
jgi:beta-phosphoglucomutase